MPNGKLIKQYQQERLNQTRKNIYGEVGTCIGFENDNQATMVKILLENKNIIICRWGRFDKGKFNTHVTKDIQRIGEENINTQGSHMKIIDYKKIDDITVKFDTGYIAEHMRYDHFKEGKIKDLLYPHVQNKGFHGVGKYNSQSILYGIKLYKTWSSMLDRCYGITQEKNNPSYKGCEVNETWFNFQNFAEWIDKNGYSIPNQKMVLDKDILFKNNKIYGPDTCCIVPEEINILFIKTDKMRGEYPIGVHKDGNKYNAMIHMKRLGNKYKRFDTPEEAFQFYKQEKEKYIKYLADIYKNDIPIKLYNALYNYEVEITD